MNPNIGIIKIGGLRIDTILYEFLIIYFVIAFYTAFILMKFIFWLKLSAKSFRQKVDFFLITVLAIFALYYFVISNIIFHFNYFPVYFSFIVGGILGAFTEIHHQKIIKQIPPDISRAVQSRFGIKSVIIYVIVFLTLVFIISFFVGANSDRQEEEYIKKQNELMN